MLSGEELETFLGNTVQVFHSHFQETLPFLYLMLPRLWVRLLSSLLPQINLEGGRSH